MICNDFQSIVLLFSKVKQLHNKLLVMQKTLTETTDTLCAEDKLLPGKMLRSLKSKGALETDDVERIKKETTTSEQVRKMTGVLMMKPVSDSNSYMDILKEEGPDLYEKVMDIQGEL